VLLFGVILASAPLSLVGCQPVEGPVSGHATVEWEPFPSPPDDLDVPLPGQRDAVQEATPASNAERPAVRASDERESDRPVADRSWRPVRQGAVNDITFDDLELDMPLATLFDRSMLTPRAAELDNQLVRIRGFMFAGGVFQQSGIKSFPLVKNTECKFGPQGLAYCVILVELDEGVTTNFTTYPITVEGTLTVRPFNAGGFTWSVYHLQGRRVY
jgi:hypothetical protein